MPDMPPEFGWPSGYQRYIGRWYSASTPPPTENEYAVDAGTVGAQAAIGWTHRYGLAIHWHSDAINAEAGHSAYIVKEPMTWHLQGIGPPETWYPESYEGTTPGKCGYYFLNVGTDFAVAAGGAGRVQVMYGPTPDRSTFPGGFHMWLGMEGTPDSDHYVDVWEVWTAAQVEYPAPDHDCSPIARPPFPYSDPVLNLGLGPAADVPYKNLLAN